MIGARTLPVFAFCATLCAQGTGGAGPQIVVTLAPATSANAVVAMNVTLEINDLDTNSKDNFALRIPVEFAGIHHVADRIENLEASGPAGALTLTQSDERPDAGGSLYWRRWKLDAPAPSQLTVHYRARLDPPHPWPGPPFDLRSNAGGVSGAGFGFLVLPDSKNDFSIALKWDLQNMPSGARAVSSLGEGDIRTRGPIERLQACFYIAGPLGTYPDPFSAGVFRSAWLGDPPFDAKSEMKWSADAYLALHQFFFESGAQPFYFFMRAGKDNGSYGGAALANSFLLFAPEAGTPMRDHSPPRLIIAHEITHHFVGGLTSPDGIEGSWFSEGLAEYYSRWVTFRAGLIPPSRFLEAVNESAQGYYTNPVNTLPNDKIAVAFWRDKRAQTLPYQRGFLYFADTNSKLLAGSHGKISLDTLILPLIARRNSGEKVTPETWRTAVAKQLGSEGEHEFDSIILHGDLVVPASDAFGPCFERREAKMQLFDLGFDQHKSLDVDPRVIRDLEPDSPAEKAGLLNGDIVVSLDPPDIDRLRSHLTERISLRVKRGNDILPIDYLPRSSQAVQGYEWTRRPSVPDNKCAAW